MYIISTRFYILVHAVLTFFFIHPQTHNQPHQAAVMLRRWVIHIVPSPWTFTNGSIHELCALHLKCDCALVPNSGDALTVY